MSVTILLAGLPGSGKTTYIKRVLQYQFDDLVVVDDPLTDEDVGRALKAVGAGKNVVISDPNFCRKTARERARTLVLEFNPETNVVELFFENDPENCLKNIQRRNDGRVVGKSWVLNLSSNYDPKGTVIPVYKG